MDKTDPLIRLRQAVSLPGRETSDFDLNPDYSAPVNRVLRPAAVLVAVQKGLAGPEVVLTKRSSRLKHHPGQIAFPGGKLDEEDDGAVGAALREAREEIGLDMALVEVFGTLPSHETVTGFEITPVVGCITGAFTARPEAGEVEEVFTVPLAHVTDPGRFFIERRRWRNEWRQFFTVPYGPYYIWGATARILRVLADRMVK